MVAKTQSTSISARDRTTGSPRVARPGAVERDYSRGIIELWN